MKEIKGLVKTIKTPKLKKTAISQPLNVKKLTKSIDLNKSNKKIPQQLNAAAVVTPKTSNTSNKDLDLKIKLISLTPLISLETKEIIQIKQQSPTAKKHLKSFNLSLSPLKKPIKKVSKNKHISIKNVKNAVKDVKENKEIKKGLVVLPKVSTIISKIQKQKVEPKKQNSRVEELIRLNTRRGYRLSKGYPANGQRTKTNGKTSRKSR